MSDIQISAVEDSSGNPLDSSGSFVGAKLSMYSSPNQVNSLKSDCKKINEFYLLDDNLESVFDWKKISECNDIEKLDNLLRKAQKSLEHNREILRQLVMVKRYRTKNNPEKLVSLITKWRQVSQDAIFHLSRLMEKPSLTQIIDGLQISHQLLCYNAEEESFELEK